MCKEVILKALVLCVVRGIRVIRVVTAFRLLASPFCRVRRRGVVGSDVSVPGGTVQVMRLRQRDGGRCTNGPALRTRASTPHLALSRGILNPLFLCWELKPFVKQRVADTF